MSTLTGEEHPIALERAEDLAGYFHEFAKTRDQRRVGLEAEFLGVSRRDGRALSFEGTGGVEQILEAWAERFGYERLLETGRVIGLRKGDLRIALEPGAQIELSAPPVVSVFDVEKQIGTFLEQWREVRKNFQEVSWLAYGIQPVSRLDEIPWVPKKRYAIMSHYFEGRGTLSHWMMKKTATNQINLDYSDEQNAMRNLRTALGITSIVSALFAHSPVSEGRASGYRSERLNIWNHTDPARSGLLPGLLRPDRTFQDYLDYILDMPVIFLIREGSWIAVKDRTFRQYLRDGYSGTRATLGDFELHLSTAFPEVRLKQYIELRGADAQSPQLILALAAFWKGILYDERACCEAWEVVASAREEDRLRLHAEVPRKGLEASLGDLPIRPMAGELVGISKRGLERQSRETGSPGEGVFLEPVERQILRTGKSPAEAVLESWDGWMGKNSQQLIESLEVR
ncbi:MAG: glutamate-cysteine ligase family protein [Candidatus Omnitrophota bacterium]